MCLSAICKLTQPTLCLPEPIAQCSVEFNSLVCVSETDTEVYLIEMECTYYSWQCYNGLFLTRCGQIPLFQRGLHSARPSMHQ